MILEGMVLHLPRPRFRVTVCAVGGKVSRTLENGADEVARLPRTLAGARLGLEQLRRVFTHHAEVAYAAARAGHAPPLTGPLEKWKSLEHLS